MNPFNKQFDRLTAPRAALSKVEGISVYPERPKGDKMKKVILIAVVGLILILIFNYAYTQERITLSTYYPAPYGEYRKLAIGSSAGGYTAPSSPDIDLVVEGNVGIGTTSPNATLQVGEGLTTSSTGDGVIRVGTKNGGWREWDFGVDSTTSPYDFYIKDTQMASPAMVIEYETGNVGIGTTAPQAKLDVVSDSTARLRIFTDGDFLGVGEEAKLDFQFYDTPESPDSPHGQIKMLGTGGAFNYGGDMVFSLAPGSTYPEPLIEQMRITRYGNVGIGTTNPQAKLHVGGTAGTDGIMFPDGTVQTTSATPLPKARVYLNYRQQNLIQNIWTVVRLNAISYDPDSIVNVGTYRTTISEAGYYAITAHVTFINVTSGRLYYAAIRKNGDAFVTIAGAHTSTTYNLPVLIADTVYLTAGDYLELVVEPRDTGNATDLGGGATEDMYTYLAIRKIP